MASTLLDFTEEGYLISKTGQSAYIQASTEAYEQAYQEIDTILQKYYKKMENAVDPDDYFRYSLEVNRLQSLQTEIRKVYSKYSKLAGNSVEAGLNFSMIESYNRQQFLTAWQDIDNVLKVNPINENLVKFSVTGNIEAWKKIQSDAFTKINGVASLYAPQAGTLTSLLTNNYTQEINQIFTSVNSAMVSGQSYLQLSNTIHNIIGQTDEQGAKYKSLRIARTEGARTIGGGALNSAYKASSQGLEIFREWLATLDGKTRNPHGQLDGTKILLGEKFVSPISGNKAESPATFGNAQDDINCRCTIIDLVGDTNPLVRKGRNPETGETEFINWTNYSDWVEKNKLNENRTKRAREVSKLAEFEVTN